MTQDPIEVWACAQGELAWYCMGREFERAIKNFAPVARVRCLEIGSQWVVTLGWPTVIDNAVKLVNMALTLDRFELPFLHHKVYEAFRWIAASARQYPLADPPLGFSALDGRIAT